MLTKWGKILLAGRIDSNPPYGSQPYLFNVLDYIKSCNFVIRNVNGMQFLPAQESYHVGIPYHYDFFNNTEYKKYLRAYLPCVNSSNFTVNDSNFVYDIKENEWKKRYDEFFSDDTSTDADLGRYLSGAISFSFGSGNKKENFNDYCLENPIKDGINITNISVTQGMEGPLFKILYTITCNATKDLIIKELGMYKIVFPEEAIILDRSISPYKLVQKKDTEKVMIAREVLDTTLNVTRDSMFSLSLELSI